VLIGSVQLFLVSVGLTYFLGMTAAGLKVLRESRDGGSPPRRAGWLLAVWSAQPVRRLIRPVSAARERLTGHLATAEQPPLRVAGGCAPEDLAVYFLVPCLNEELVVEGTVRELLSDPRARVLVIDDGSDDRTGELAAAVDPARVMIVRRELPDARRGKGPALNAGFARMLQDADVRGVPVEQVIVCVMDADGRLSPGALDQVLPLFSDPEVGGVQLPVRIRNRRGLLALMQDVEFWGLSAISQFGRVKSGTVSLGGNGQFTRLCALLSLNRDPWQPSLTEDLDLALALAVKGWRLTTTPWAYVSQQAITSLKALVRQRTRWFQGHMASVQWLPRLWSSRRLSHLGMLEMTLYLLVPWLLVLPWSVVWNYGLIVLVFRIAEGGQFAVFGGSLVQQAMVLLLWYGVSCLPSWLSGYLYFRQERGAGFGRAVLLGHLLLVWNYLAFVCCWRAAYRMVAHRSGWDKTAREHELPRGRTETMAGLTLGPADRDDALGRAYEN